MDIVCNLLGSHDLLLYGMLVRNQATAVNDLLKVICKLCFTLIKFLDSVLLDLVFLLQTFILCLHIFESFLKILQLSISVMIFLQQYFDRLLVG